jgi:hypothetical protein
MLQEDRVILAGKGVAIDPSNGKKRAAMLNDLLSG